MIRCKRKSVEVTAIKFDPINEHRCKLPDGVNGVPSPNADNWGYEGCTFYIRAGRGINLANHRVLAGDYLIYENNVLVAAYQPHDFKNLFEILS